MEKKANVIAIDGPAGSGKSTVAKGVAKRLGYFYIDTGAMYRALTLKAIENKIDLNNGNLLKELSQNTEISFESTDSSLKVLLDGRDVTGQIRDLSLSDKVKFIAQVEGVRASMVERQRSLGVKSNGAVLEGRDIGTVVFPDAKYKFYIDASFDERIKRRFLEFEGKGVKVDREDVERDLRGRDTSDKTRSSGPLKQAKDAVYMDTTSMSIEEVIEDILKSVERKG